MRFIGLQNFIDVTAGVLLPGPQLSIRLSTRSGPWFWASAADPHGRDAQRDQAVQGVFPLHGLLSLHRSGVAAAILWSLIYHPTSGLLNSLLSIFGIDAIPWLQSQNLVIPWHRHHDDVEGLRLDRHFVPCEPAGRHPGAV